MNNNSFNFQNEIWLREAIQKISNSLETLTNPEFIVNIYIDCQKATGNSNVFKLKEKFYGGVNNIDVVVNAVEYFPTLDYTYDSVNNSITIFGDILPANTRVKMKYIIGKYGSSSLFIDTFKALGTANVFTLSNKPKIAESISLDVNVGGVELFPEEDFTYDLQTNSITAKGELIKKDTRVKIVYMTT